MIKTMMQTINQLPSQYVNCERYSGKQSLVCCCVFVFYSKSSTKPNLICKWSNMIGQVEKMSRKKVFKLKKNYTQSETIQWIKFHAQFIRTANWLEKTKQTKPNRKTETKGQQLQWPASILFHIQTQTHTPNRLNTRTIQTERVFLW